MASSFVNPIYNGTKRPLYIHKQPAICDLLMNTCQYLNNVQIKHTLAEWSFIICH